MTGPRIEARHPDNPTARWAKFQAGVREAATRSAEHRAQRDREREHGAQYHRTAEQSKGAAP